MDSLLKDLIKQEKEKKVIRVIPDKCTIECRKKCNFKCALSISMEKRK